MRPRLPGRHASRPRCTLTWWTERFAPLLAAGTITPPRKTCFRIRAQKNTNSPFSSFSRAESKSAVRFAKFLHPRGGDRRLARLSRTRPEVAPHVSVDRAWCTTHSADATWCAAVHGPSHALKSNNNFWESVFGHPDSEFNKQIAVFKRFSALNPNPTSVCPKSFSKIQKKQQKANLAVDTSLGPSMASL